MRSALAAAAAALLLSAPAQAQDEYWRMVELPGGCTFASPAQFEFPPDAAFAWSGAACEAGAPVSGEGAVSITFRRAPDQPALTAISEGQWVHGYPHGLFVTQIRAPDGRLLRESRTLYNMGCMTDSADNVCVPGAAE